MHPLHQKFKGFLIFQFLLKWRPHFWPKFFNWRSKLCITFFIINFLFNYGGIILIFFEVLFYIFFYLNIQRKFFSSIFGEMAHSILAKFLNWCFIGNL